MSIHETEKFDSAIAMISLICEALSLFSKILLNTPKKKADVMYCVCIDMDCACTYMEGVVSRDVPHVLVLS